MPIRPDPQLRLLFLSALALACSTSLFSGALALLGAIGPAAIA